MKYFDHDELKKIINSCKQYKFITTNRGFNPVYNKEDFIKWRLAFLLNHSVYGVSSMNKKEIKNMLEVRSNGKPKMSFIDRLKVERMHLRHKVKQLEDFINKHDRPTDTLICEEEMDYMKVQLHHMKGYLHFIDKRLQVHGYIPKDIEQ